MIGGKVVRWDPKKTLKIRSKQKCDIPTWGVKDIAKKIQHTVHVDTEFKKTFLSMLDSQFHNLVSKSSMSRYYFREGVDFIFLQSTVVLNFVVYCTSDKLNPFGNAELRPCHVTSLTDVGFIYEIRPSYLDTSL